MSDTTDRPLEQLAARGFRRIMVEEPEAPNTAERPSAGDPVAQYRYIDGQGRLAFTVERYEPKRFRIVDAAGQKHDSPPKRLLYRLPELRGSRPADTVFVVEGEKDVETLLSRGHELSPLREMVATTNPGGTRAGWHENYTRALRGRHVVILPDCDKPGMAHAETVRDALVGTAASVVIVQLPGLRPPQDISDWLQRRSLRELDQLVTVARYRASPVGRAPSGGPAKQALIFGSGLRPSERLVLLALNHHQPHASTPIPASQLAAYTGLNRVTVQNLLTALRDQGVISRNARSSWDIHWEILAIQQPAVARRTRGAAPR